MRFFAVVVVLSCVFLATCVSGGTSIQGIVDGDFSDVADFDTNWNPSNGSITIDANGYVEIPNDTVGDQTQDLQISQTVPIPVGSTNIVLTVCIAGGSTEVLINGLPPKGNILSLSPGKTLACKSYDLTAGGSTDVALLAVGVTSSVVVNVSLTYDAPPPTTPAPTTPAPTTPAPTTPEVTTPAATTPAPTTTPQPTTPAPTTTPLPTTPAPTTTPLPTTPAPTTTQHPTPPAGTTPAAKPRCSRYFIGPNNPAGPYNPKGPSNPDGCDGPTGPSGPNGPDNGEGPTGPSGPDGPTGETGATGKTGKTGPSGPTGKTGKTNWTGPTNPSGPSS